MKILWVKTDFLHPTTRGGQIRTLEMLRRLHARHEVHYAAFDDPEHPEGLQRAGEYSTRAYPVRHRVASKRSPRFLLDLLRGVVSPLPVAVGRYRSDEMRRLISSLRQKENFDSVICDFLAPAPNIEDLRNCVLFQHNVETAIWQRHHQHAPDPLRRAYLGMQASKMFEYERDVCRSVAHVIAVSDADAELMRSMFGAASVSAVPTGVDIEYFTPSTAAAAGADLVFVGSMDWLPNIDGVKWFTAEILPLIRARRPACTVAIVGRKPGPDIVSLSGGGIQVTGTVPDVRPHLWGASVSIVPLRIGGGTRLKIYESMAAGTAVVSTTVGAEGLDVSSPENILLADTPQTFADACLRLLDDAQQRRRVSAAAHELVSTRFSWDAVADRFADALQIGAGAER